MGEREERGRERERLRERGRGQKGETEGERQGERGRETEIGGEKRRDRETESERETNRARERVRESERVRDDAQAHAHNRIGPLWGRRRARGRSAASSSRPARCPRRGRRGTPEGAPQTPAGTARSPVVCVCVCARARAPRGFCVSAAGASQNRDPPEPVCNAMPAIRMHRHPSARAHARTYTPYQHSPRRAIRGRSPASESAPPLEEHKRFTHPPGAHACTQRNCTAGRKHRRKGDWARAVCAGVGWRGRAA